MRPRILIIDDEPDIRKLLSITVERMGYDALCVGAVGAAVDGLSAGAFDLCLTDLKLPDGSGIDIVKIIRQHYPSIPVIVITAHGSMDVAIDAMKYGAFDFINKPVDLHHLRKLINNATATKALTTSQDAIDDIIGQSKPAVKLKESISKVARSQAPIFIFGESGSGKELVARAIHKFSSRKHQPFITVNCGAIPGELMESEFFGHTKGSFTGAHQDKQGLFQSAEGGTLFLDEVADLPLDMQVKLLRALQEKTIRPVGSRREIPVDVRILSATHKNLLNAIQQGAFRSDLYYRINVIELNVPSLRERRGDIERLAAALLKKIADNNRQPVRALSPGALSALRAYDFPGNIRELENILERASALCESGGIEVRDLQLQPLPDVTESAGEPLAGMTEPWAMEPGYQPENQSIDEYLDNIEKNIILNHLQSNRWNRTATAKVLGTTVRSLRYRMQKLGIADEL